MLMLLKAWWKPLAGVAAVLTLLLLYRAQLQKAEARGYDRAMIEATKASAAASMAYMAQVGAAERDQSKREAARRARLSPIKQKANDYARTADMCPDTAGRVLINEAIRASDDTAAAAKGR